MLRLLLWMLSTADAGEPASFPSSPPIGIDDTETVEKHHCEINFTVGFSGRPGNWEAETPLIDGNYGLTDNIHVNAEIPYVVGAEDGSPNHGIGRGAVAVKVRVLHQERLQLAFHPAVEFPPLPVGSYEKSGVATVTIPVVLDLAVGEHGAGVGIQFSRSFNGLSLDGDWGAALGFASPLNDESDILFDYTQQADPLLRFGEGWFEVGYVHGNLFGSEHLTLLSSVGRSTQGNTSVLLGVQVGL